MKTPLSLLFAAALPAAVNLSVAAAPPAMPLVSRDLTALHDATRVISDDFVYALKDPGEREILHQHILTNGINYRDFRRRWWQGPLLPSV